MVDPPNDRDTAGAARPPSGSTNAPSPPPSSPRPPLRRPREGRVLTGVAAGIADHLGIDVVIVRIVIVVLAVVTEGLMVLAYIAAAIFVPAAEPGAPRPEPRRGTSTNGERDPLFWVGVGVLVVSLLWLIRGGLFGTAILPGGRGFGGLIVPLVLIGFGLALWRAGDRREAVAGHDVQGPPSAPTYGSASGPTYGSASGPTSPAGSSMSAFTASTEQTMTSDTRTHPNTPYPDPATTWRSEGAGGSPPPPPGTGQPYGEPNWTPPPPPERRQRSLLTHATLGLALVVVGVLWSLRVADVLAIGWGTILAGGLMVIGIGLLVGSVIGRARWLILVGALIAPVVVLAQVAPFAYLTDGWNIDSDNAGEIRSTPTNLDELRPEYQLGAGSIRLDLTELDLSGQDVEVNVDLGAGEIRVVVPDDVEVVATGRSGIGQVRLFDARFAGGIGAGEQQATFTPDGDPRGRIELQLQTGLGEVRVEAAPSRVAGFGQADAEGPLTPEREREPEPEPEPESEAEPEPSPEPAPEPEPATSGA